MDTLQNPEVVLKLHNQMTIIPMQIWLVRDGPLIRLKPFLRYAIVSQHAPVLLQVSSGAQEGDEGFANAHIVWSCVVVQLLVPLLIEMSGSFWNLVPVHDVQDLVTDLLPSVATTSKCCEREARPHADIRVLLPDVADFDSKAVCGTSKLPRLRVVVALPVQEAHEGEALPCEDPAPELRIAGLVLLCRRFLQQGEGWHP
mmetsp:Transcript_13442/g.38205  ORF Transcript_13442/g.38205 Transcript_13442/m.38205 type:complete len:200 (+) Transcript_13442:2124-2723(+)